MGTIWRGALVLNSGSQPAIPLRGLRPRTSRKPAAARADAAGQAHCGGHVSDPAVAGHRSVQATRKCAGCPNAGVRFGPERTSAEASDNLAQRRVATLVRPVAECSTQVSARSSRTLRGWASTRSKFDRTEVRLGIFARDFATSAASQGQNGNSSRANWYGRSSWRESRSYSHPQ